MEIYCHPVANGTYYFSGACSSTGRCHIGPAVFPVPWIPDSWPGQCSSISLDCRCSLPWLWFDFNTSICSLPRVASATYNIHFILCPHPLDTLSCPLSSPPHAVACVLCMFSQRWSLKACNVPLPHSTAFFFNTSIYSSFGQLPKKKEKKRKKNCRETCVKKCPFTAPHRSCSPQLASEIRANTRYQYLCNFLWLRLLNLSSPSPSAFVVASDNCFLVPSPESPAYWQGIK